MQYESPISSSYRRIGRSVDVCGVRAEMADDLSGVRREQRSDQIVVRILREGAGTKLGELREVLCVEIDVQRPVFRVEAGGRGWQEMETGLQPRARSNDEIPDVSFDRIDNHAVERTHGLVARADENGAVEPSRGRFHVLGSDVPKG